MRQLKFHERKLLKKVDFLQWKSENNHRELEVSLCGTPPLLQLAVALHFRQDFVSVSLQSGPFVCLQIMRRYHIQGRDDYKKYSKLCGMVTRLVHFLKKLDSSDPTRIELTDQMLEK